MKKYNFLFTKTKILVKLRVVARRRPFSWRHISHKKINKRIPCSWESFIHGMNSKRIHVEKDFLVFYWSSEFARWNGLQRNLHFEKSLMWTKCPCQTCPRMTYLWKYIIMRQLSLLWKIWNARWFFFSFLNDEESNVIIFISRNWWVHHLLLLEWQIPLEKI